jgi:hypothetical protein
MSSKREKYKNLEAGQGTTVSTCYNFKTPTQIYILLSFTKKQPKTKCLNIQSKNEIQASTI